MVKPLVIVCSSGKYRSKCNPLIANTILPQQLIMRERDILRRIRRIADAHRKYRQTVSGLAGQDLVDKFQELPEEMRSFISQPVNRPYLELAMKLSEMSKERLRSVAATMGKDPNQLQKGGKSATLAQMGLMAEYLEGLPYLSEVLSLDEETWKGMEGLEQEKFIRRLNTKLKYYQKYNADADRWVSLAEGSDPRDHVYPVPLEALP